MSKSDPTASEIERLQEASDWLQRLNEPSADPTLADEWSQWCRSDPMNLPVFERIQRTWDAFSEVKASGGAVYRIPQAQNRPKGRIRLIALAASVVMAATVGLLALRYSEVRELHTSVGEQRRLLLADGSVLDLAPDSRVTTRFTLARREVRLERGEAFFTVAHSALRPFVVEAIGLRVTAVGTAFDLRIGDTGTVLTVGEGWVSVAPGTDQAGGETASGTVRAGAGQRVAFSTSAHRLGVATVDPTVAGSWRDGTLQFVGEPLQDVVGAVNRYRAPPIAVAPAFQQTRFTGTVSPANVRDWLKALEQIYAVEVVDQGAKGMLIRSRAEHGA